MSGPLRLALVARARSKFSVSTTSPPTTGTRAANHPGQRSETYSMSQRRRAGTAASRGSGGGAAGGGSGSGEGARLAEQLVDTAEATVEQLEKRMGAEKPEAHLGPAPTAEGEEATVLYFAYGSNMHKSVFQGRRMIKPAESLPAMLPGWRLTFNQPGLPYSEPAFAAVEPVIASGGANGAHGGSAASSEQQQRTQPEVHGVVHRITPSQWNYVLETEGASSQDEKSESGYRVVTATAVAYDGTELPGVMTLSVHEKTKARLRGREAQPSKRYLTLIREGAADYGLSADYRGWLEGLQHYEATTPGQKLGVWIFRLVAFVGIFPVFAGVRLLRRITGMKSATGDAVGRFMGRYTALMFATVLRVHEVLRPALGCGMTSGAKGGSAGGGAR